MRRVSVVGNSGSGKTTLARRIAALIGAPHVEIDALHHLPGWVERPTEELIDELERITRGDAWVVDGNYRRAVVEGPVWDRADLIVWVDPPRWVVMAQILRRTLWRGITRRELWNGNRERLLTQVSLDPERSVVTWAWVSHAKYRDRYGAAMRERPNMVRLRSRRAAEEWLRTL